MTFEEAFPLLATVVFDKIARPLSGCACKAEQNALLYWIIRKVLRLTGCEGLQALDSTHPNRKEHHSFRSRLRRRGRQTKTDLATAAEQLGECTTPTNLSAIRVANRKGGGGSPPIPLLLCSQKGNMELQMEFQGSCFPSPPNFILPQNGGPFGLVVEGKRLSRNFHVRRPRRVYAPPSGSSTQRLAPVS